MFLSKLAAWVNIFLESVYDESRFRSFDQNVAFPFYTNGSGELDYSSSYPNPIVTLTFTSERPSVLLGQVAMYPQVSTRIRFFQVCPEPTGTPTGSPTSSLTQTPAVEGPPATLADDGEAVT